MLIFCRSWSLEEGKNSASYGTLTKLAGLDELHDQQTARVDVASPLDPPKPIPTPPLVSGKVHSTLPCNRCTPPKPPLCQYLFPFLERTLDSPLLHRVLVPKLWQPSLWLSTHITPSLSVLMQWH